MNNMTQKLVAAAMTVGLLAVVASKVHAGGTEIYGGTGGCIPVYGGGVACPQSGEVLVDKTVRNPATGIYVDNLDVIDPKYHPGEIVSFHITIHNSGGQTLDAVSVIDTIPSFVDYSSGPDRSNYDPNTRQLSFVARNIVPGATATYEVKVHVVNAAAFPAGKDIVCPLNVVEAKTSDTLDRDDAKFCIEKKVVVPVVPKAGPENWIVSLIGLGASLKAGLVLRKKRI